jgi:hypothetical protein
MLGVRKLLLKPLDMNDLAVSIRGAMKGKKE